MSTLLFNPRREVTDGLETTLVARQPLLDRLERDLLEDRRTQTARHWSLTGPRGIGKSHLTELLARRLRDRHGWTLARLPEEHYQVHSLADLIAKIAQHATGSDPESSQLPTGSEADRLDRALARLRRHPDPILVVVENLDRLLGQKIREKADQQRLRSILMHDPPFTLVTTALRPAPQTLQVDAPFHDFFELIPLRELTRDEVHALVDKRMAWDRPHGVPLSIEALHARVDAVLHLCGGNPRWVITLLGVLTRGPDTGLGNQVLELLDAATPTYQARLGELGGQQAQVLVALALGQSSATPSVVADRCGLPTNQVTANLKKLEDLRLAQPGGRPLDKRKRYWEVSDRLFRVWLQMREGASPERIRWLVRFYQAVHEAERTGADDHVQALLRRVFSGSLPTTLSDLLASAEAWDTATEASPQQLAAMVAAMDSEAPLPEAPITPSALDAVRRGQPDALDALKSSIVTGSVIAALVLALFGPADDANRAARGLTELPALYERKQVVGHLVLRALSSGDASLARALVRGHVEVHGRSRSLAGLLLTAGLATHDPQLARAAVDWLPGTDRRRQARSLLALHPDLATALLPVVLRPQGQAPLDALHHGLGLVPATTRARFHPAYQWLVAQGLVERQALWETALAVAEADDPEPLLAALHPEQRDAVDLLVG